MNGDLSPRPDQLRDVVYGVIGDPIGHSLSPHIHNAALRHAGINAVYVPFRVPAEDLNQFLDDCPRAGRPRPERHDSAQGSGDPEAHQVDPAVKGIGAANTFVFGTDEILRLQHRLSRRRSTAWSGPCSRRIRPRQPRRARRARSGRRRRRARRSLMASRSKGADVIISSRTARRAQQLAEKIPVQVGRLEQPLRRHARRDHQLHAGGHAPQRGRVALRPAAPAAVHGRVRHRLQPREHAFHQRSPHARLHWWSPAWRCSFARPACSSSCSPARTAPGN